MIANVAPRRDVGLPHQPRPDRHERRRARTCDHRGPGAGHRALWLAVPRADRHPRRHLPRPRGPACVVLRRDRAAGPGRAPVGSRRGPARPHHGRRRDPGGGVRRGGRPADRGRGRDRLRLRAAGLDRSRRRLDPAGVRGRRGPGRAGARQGRLARSRARADRGARARRRPSRSTRFVGWATSPRWIATSRTDRGCSTWRRRWTARRHGSRPSARSRPARRRC